MQHGNNNDNVVRVSFSLQELKGTGTEYYVIDGTIVAKFFNGTLVTGEIPQGNEEITKVSNE